MTVYLHEGDLPDGLDLGPEVAIDSETMGLRFRRDPLCVVQLSAGDGDAHVVRMNRPDYDCPNLKRLLTDPAVLKLFHFGRFDIGMFQLHLGVETRPVYCTKIASKLARTYTDRHGLKDVVRELAGVDLSKAQQSSDWGAAELTPAQLEYAASDVLYLHAVKTRLDEMLEREGRADQAPQCFDLLPSRSADDLAGTSRLVPNELEIGTNRRARTFVEHQHHGPDEGLQGIVELVSDAGHELADR